MTARQPPPGDLREEVRLLMAGEFPCRCYEDMERCSKCRGRADVILAFALEVQAAETERCAKECDNEETRCSDNEKAADELELGDAGRYWNAMAKTAKGLAAAIRRKP